jgi:hypothetical protein
MIPSCDRSEVSRQKENIAYNREIQTLFAIARAQKISASEFAPDF